MNEETRQLCQAVHQSTRRTVEETWPLEESAETLLAWTDAALNHVEGTVDGFRQVTQAKVDCGMGCSFCCWLRIDVRAHEVFLILRQLRAQRTAEELKVLQGEARMAREALTGLDFTGREAMQRPCLMLQDGRCSVYAVRPAACRRYLSGSVQACEALWKGDPVEEAIQHPLISETGRFAAAAVHQVFVKQGYDGYSYDLPLALTEGLEDQECETRWLRKEKAFSAAAESKTPAGFSQSEALAGLRASLAGVPSKLGVWLAFFLLWGGAPFLLAETSTAADAEVAAPAEVRPLASPGNHVRKLTVEGVERSCLVHIPPRLDLSQPSPLVLVLHGAAMNAQMMASFSGMNAQADVSRFIAVYPNGTGWQNTLLRWNSGGIGPEQQKPDDVAFLRALLDDLAAALKVDPRRVFAAGLSNGGMMSYRLATEMSDRIAAIAAVGGTLTVPDPQPARAVPAIHFHGTDDRIVPYTGPARRHPSGISFQSVPETIAAWVKLTGCPDRPVVQEVPDQFDDGTTVKITTYGPGREGAEVVLVDVNGGGHTWPGKQPAVSLIGKSTREISANRMIWEFFQKHPLPEKPAR
jgi:polyhydroxybutyrate depolymerase